MAGKDDKAAKPKKKGKAGMFLIILLLGPSLLFIMPTFVMVLVATIPTIVAFMTDDDPNYSTAVAVGSLNVVGVLPFVIDLWGRGQTINVAFDIMSQMTTWVVVYGAAGVGKLIMYVVPQAIASVTLAGLERRHKLLNKNLESLRDAWGQDVGTTKPISSLLPKE